MSLVRIAVHAGNMEKGATRYKRDRKVMPKNKKGKVLLYNGIDSITKPAMTRVSRRGGVQRISNSTFQATRVALKQFVEDVVRDAIIYMQHARRSTITIADVSYALNRNGQTLYGF